MAGKPTVGEMLPANLAGMSKNQLYEIVSQMKMLIEQNQHQARQILIQNPLLTKALFQAQIMLGMVQPPKQMPNIQAPTNQNLQQMMNHQSNAQGTRLTPVQMGVPDQTVEPKIQTSERKQPQTQQAIPISSPGAIPARIQPAMIVESQPPLVPLQTPQQSKSYQIPQTNSASLSQSSQLPAIAPIPMHSSAQSSSIHKTQIPNASIQSQQSLHMSGNPQLALQPPFLSQSIPHSALNFHQHYPTGPQQSGYQSAGAPQHVSQPMFHSATKPPTGGGPSFPQGQPSLSSQPLPQSLYQAGGQQLGSEFNNQIGNPVQGDRGQSWRSGLPEMTPTAQVSGPPMLAPIQTGPSNQPSCPPPLTPEMEKALLQQVMSLTPDQINLLPPEQRNQVFQLQQMLRQ